MFFFESEAFIVAILEKGPCVALLSIREHARSFFINYSWNLSVIFKSFDVFSVQFHKFFDRVFLVLLL